MTSNKQAKLSDYLWRLQPKSWPIVFLHCAMGGELALSPRLAGGWGAPEVGWIAWGALLWAVLLNGGAQALNSGADYDQGHSGNLKNSPAAPPGLTWLGFGVMTLGALLAARFFSSAYFCLYLAGMLLAVIYAMPPLRLKALPGGDLAISMLGYGALTILAGYFSVEEQIRRVAVLAASGFACLFGALYPVLQIYQLKEDISRGAPNLTARLGIRRALSMACLFLGAAFAFFGAIHVMYGTGLVGLAACFVSFVAWLAVLVPWSAKLDAYPKQKGLHRALSAWVLTESLLAVIWLGQVLQSLG